MGEDVSAVSGQVPDPSEAALLAAIENILSKASAQYVGFQAERARTEGDLSGYSKEKLKASLQIARSFDIEFTSHEAEAQRLAQAGWPKARARLAAIQQELQQAIAELQEAYDLREALDSRLVQPTANQPPQTNIWIDLAPALASHDLAVFRKIEEVYQEFCQACQSFGAVCSQYSYGPPAAILESHWQQLEEMDSRFAQMEAEVNRLPADHRPAAIHRLALVRGDLSGTIAIVRKMHAARLTADSRSSELESHAVDDLAESMRQMNRVLSRKARFEPE